MLKRACELAAQGHRPQMIEAILAANGFPETVEFIEQHHTKKEPVELADQARRSAGETNDLRPGDIVKGEAGPSA